MAWIGLKLSAQTRSSWALTELTCTLLRSASANRRRWPATTYAKALHRVSCAVTGSSTNLRALIRACLVYQSVSPDAPAIVICLKSRPRSCFCATTLSILKRLANSARSLRKRRTMRAALRVSIGTGTRGRCSYAGACLRCLATKLWRATWRMAGCARRAASVTRRSRSGSRVARFDRDSIQPALLASQWSKAVERLLFEPFGGVLSRKVAAGQVKTIQENTRRGTGYVRAVSCDFVDRSCPCCSSTQPQ